MSIETEFTVPTPRRLFLSKSHQGPANALTVACRINCNVIKQKMIVFWQQDDKTGYGSVAFNNPSRVVADVGGVVVEHRTRSPANPVDIFGVGFRHDSRHGIEVGHTGWTDRIQHSQPRQIVSCQNYLLHLWNSCTQTWARAAGAGIGSANLGSFSLAVARRIHHERRAGRIRRRMGFG